MSRQEPRPAEVIRLGRWDARSDRAGLEVRGRVPGAVYAYGRTVPGRQVTVEIGGHQVAARAGDTGWWAVVSPDSS